MYQLSSSGEHRSSKAPKMVPAFLLLYTLVVNVLPLEAGPYQSLGGHMHPDLEEVEMRALSRHKRDLPTPTDRDGCKQGGTAPPNRVDTNNQLSQLRAKMADNQIQGFIIPMADAHQSEYVSNHDHRIRFISGFSGSSGTVVVLADKAAIWVDGRYFLQSEQELDCQWTIMKSGITGTPSISGWLKEVLQPGNKVGADPKLLSYDKWRSYRDAIKEAGIELKEQDDLVDNVWAAIGGRPAAPANPLIALGNEFAGLSWLEKVAKVRQGFGSNAKAAVYTALDDVAWLFNLRGSDISYNPVFYAYAIIKEDRITLYLSSKNERLTSEIATHLNTATSGSCTDYNNCVEVKDYPDFYSDLQTFRQGVTSEKVWVSPMSSYAVFSSLGATEDAATNKTYVKPSWVRQLKGRKNPTEIEGLRKCHIRDSAAVIEFMATLEKDIVEGRKEWDEISASDELERMRRAQEYNKGLSFATISASGPNGAVIHYKASETTKRPITTSDVYLLDSGGQYLDGTTDVTRTFHFGQPTDFQKEAYTRVLMGVIDLAAVVWPSSGKVYGRDLDVLARRPLWSVGLDYRHGTGHGIGAFLNVHEGPGRINIGYRATAHEAPLEGEMFFSDEPGYYKDGEFGIRLETIVMTTPKNTPNRFNDVDYLGFEAFTLVPFEPKLIKLDILNAEQRQWLNEYHRKVQDEIAEKILKPQGKTLAYDWVTARTAMIPDVPIYNGGSSHFKINHTYSLVLAFSLLGLIIFKQ